MRLACYTLGMWDILGAYGDYLIGYVQRSTNRTYWLFLLTGLIGAMISFRMYADEPFSLKAFTRYAFPKKAFFSRSAYADYVIALLRPVWLVVLVVPLSALMVTGVDAMGAKLDIWFGDRPDQAMGMAGMVFYTLLLALMADFALFACHYLFHRVWFLWELHKVHHSAEVMNPLTAFRFHPIEDLVNVTTVALSVGVVKSAFLWWYGADPISWKIMGLDGVVFVFYLLAYNLRHSHIWLPYPQRVSHMLISPAQHQIHHSIARKHWNKNLGFTFAFWDWAAGTLYVPKEREKLTYGLGTGEDHAYHSPIGIYIRPMASIIHRLIPMKENKHDA